MGCAHPSFFFFFFLIQWLLLETFCTPGQSLIWHLLNYPGITLAWVILSGAIHCSDSLWGKKTDNGLLNPAHHHHHPWDVFMYRILFHKELHVRAIRSILNVKTDVLWTEQTSWDEKNLLFSQRQHINFFSTTAYQIWDRKSGSPSELTSFPQQSPKSY